MKTSPLHYGKFAASVFLAASLVILPQHGVVAQDSPNGVKVEVKTYKVMKPLPGHELKLPEEIPTDARPAILEALGKIQPGGPPILVAPSDVVSQYRDLVDKAIAQSGLAASGGGMVPNFLGIDDCAFWIVVIIVIIVVIVIIYVLWKICQLIPPTQTTNSTPIYDDPSLVGTLGDGSGSNGSRQLQFSCGNLYNLAGGTNRVCDLQANLDIGTTNWFRLCTLEFSQMVQVITNGVDLGYWAKMTIIGTNGQVIATTLVAGPSTNKATLYQQRSDPIRIPAVPSSQMFFRLKVGSSL